VEKSAGSSETFSLPRGKPAPAAARRFPSSSPVPPQEAAASATAPINPIAIERVCAVSGMLPYPGDEAGTQIA
jgi:hypothetical protein